MEGDNDEYNDFLFFSLVYLWVIDLYYKHTWCVTSKSKEIQKKKNTV